MLNKKLLAHQILINYHEETKHHYHRYARSLGYMDWDNQPNPFRFFKGSDLIKLPFAKSNLNASFADLFDRDSNVPYPLTSEHLSLFLELSLGISAWKSIPGNKWALRMNPSSGNLHPTEAYVLLWQKGILSSGLFHYNPYLHALEKRMYFSENIHNQLKGHFPEGLFIFGLTSIFWREVWKYGERAYRYCNHDVGHAIAAASFAANLMGWQLNYLDELSDEDLCICLGLKKTVYEKFEEEHPDILAVITPNKTPQQTFSLPETLIRSVEGISKQGQPNKLSKEHVDWKIISTAAQASNKPRTKHESIEQENPAFLAHLPTKLLAEQIIRQRRSAVDFDGKTEITKEIFFNLLDKTLSRINTPPFDFGLGSPQVHLFLFVHRVKGLTPGLYFFVRNPEQLSHIKSSCHSKFMWEIIRPDFPLYLLGEGGCGLEATEISCGQDIAGDSAFSLGMIAKFKENVELNAYRYRHLFWETGLIGQVLYLTAEAYGVRGTGIGCFFDDSVHNILGIKDNQYQSLYHFTIGGPVDDPRLQTLAPYHHLNSCFR